MKTSDDVRKLVSKAYAKAVSGRGGCCGGQAKSRVDMAGMAGYRSEELATLPPTVVANSFGCGNPLAYSEVQPGDVVVDLGSGAGIDLILAAEKVGPTGRVIGVDMTEAMIETARENIRQSGLNHVEVRQGLIEALPIEDQSVDWVISNCVINLSPEKERVFAEIARVLKPGGRLLISDIVAEELPDWLRRDASSIAACLGGAINEADYLKGLKNAGLEAVTVRDRRIYEADELKAFIQAEGKGVELLLFARTGQSIEQLAKRYAGTVWSAKFFARKPAE